jgi:hypothetical protein
MKTQLPTFLTLNEVSRHTGQPPSRVSAALDAGLITAAGRAGAHKAAAVIFNSEQLPSIAAALASGSPAPRAIAQSANPLQVIEKFEALTRAAQEAGK